ncbi:MAG: DUF1349 domain-containing protein [Verrucomicrobiota bacterium]
MPIRVSTWNVVPEERSVSIPVPSSPAVKKVYFQIHNIRFGGQLSIKFNNKSWRNIYNDTIELSREDDGFNGIGGINSTISFYLPVSGSEIIEGQNNTIYFRLNGTDGVTTVVRVLDIDFIANNGNRLLPAGTLTQEDPSLWTAPLNSQNNFNKGRDLWFQEDHLINDPISMKPIRASCSDCHFNDGSDLKYFNYSNESIRTRSQFHGLTEQQGNQIASYIRKLNLNLPNGMDPPGRPWNPPFQPGPDTDPTDADTQLQKDIKAASWMAGKGIDAVAKTDQEVYDAMFPNGSGFGNVAELVNHMATLSVRNLPMTTQFPDWNQWLPDLAPKDIWADSVMLNDVRLGNSESDPLPGFLSSVGMQVNEGPGWLFDRLNNQLDITAGGPGPAAIATNGNLNKTFGDFTFDMETEWYGGMRRLTNGANENDELWQVVNAGITRDEFREALVRWRAVKAAYLVRLYNLETVQDAPVGSYSPANVPFYSPEPLSFPTWRPKPIAWIMAPHIIGDDFDRFDEQEFNDGKHMSNQWYLLQLVLNTGSRRPGDINLPLDWDYLGNHIQHSYDHSKFDYVMAMLLNRVKTLQMRANGNGINKQGFSLRVTSPEYLYSDADLQRDLFKGLDEFDPDLWRRVFEEYLHEFMWIMESNNLNTMPRFVDNDVLEPADFVPAPWPGGNEAYFYSNFCVSMYRLLPLLEDDNVNPALIEDFISYLIEAFPLNAGGNWSNTPYWDQITTANNYLYLENHEDGASDLSGISNIESIKNSNYQNTSASNGIPRNGGARYIGRRNLNPGQNVKANDSVSIPLNGATKLRLSCRTAFKYNNNGSGLTSVRMQVRFNNGTVKNGPWVDLNPALYGEKFQTYEADVFPPNGVNSINRVQVNWRRQNAAEGGSGNGRVYIDNVMVQDVSPINDTTAPAVPSIANINKSFNRILSVKITPSSSPDVAGYNVYRWDPGQTASDAVKLTKALHSPLQDKYPDMSAKRGVFHTYAVTAVDKAGNESAFSSPSSRSIVSTAPNLFPDWTWLTEYTNSTFQLQWFGVPNTDIKGFNVYRKAEGETSFTLQNSDPAIPVYLDDNSFNSQNGYQYYVNPVTSKGELDNSNHVLVVAADGSGGLEAWSSEDIGAPILSGSASIDTAGNFTVQGAGTDIWGTDDQFHFIHVPLYGDGRITARVVSLDYTSDWAKAGVMIRETNASGSKHASMIISGHGRASFQRRLTTGGISSYNDKNNSAAPYWVRLQRIGNTITATRSANGNNWKSVGSITLDMAEEVMIGLCVTSNNENSLNTAQFDNVEFIQW